MSEYCTATQVSHRLKAAGYLNIADEDDDGSLSAEELQNNISTGIAWAGGKLDFYVVNRSPPYDVNNLRDGPNPWCTQRAIDLAAWHAVTNGGRNAPESLQVAKNEALEELKQVMQHARTIPGTSIDTDFNANNHEPFHLVSEYLI